MSQEENATPVFKHFWLKHFLGLVYIPENKFLWRLRRWIRRKFNLYADEAHIAAWIYQGLTTEQVASFTGPVTSDDLGHTAVLWYQHSGIDFGYRVLPNNVYDAATIEAFKRIVEMVHMLVNDA